MSNLEKKVSDFLASGDIDQAIKELESGKKKAPDFVFFRLKGSIETLAGNYESGRKYFEKSIECIRGRREVDNNSVVLFGSNGRNFGDRIQEDILSHYNIEYDKTNNPSESNFFCTGSVLHKLNESFKNNVTLIGAGLIYPIPVKCKAILNVVGLRGKLSASALKVDPIFLGDPGIIIDSVYPSVGSEGKDVVVGLVPHYNDISDPVFLNIVNSHPSEVSIIDVRQSPRVVCEKIAKCQYVIASSLHGMVVALSFGIPAAAVFLSAKVMGNGFKFYDFVSCFEDKNYFPFVSLNGRESVSELINKIPGLPADIGAVKENVSNGFYNYSRSHGFLISK